VIISLAVLVTFLTQFPESIISQTCAEQYSQVLGTGPLGVYDVDAAVMDFVEEHIHPGMSRMEVMSALPNIRHTDYFPPYWEEGLIRICECPTFFYYYGVEFNGNELVSISRGQILINRSFFWYLR